MKPFLDVSITHEVPVVVDATLAASQQMQHHHAVHAQAAPREEVRPNEQDFNNQALTILKEQPVVAPNGNVRAVPQEANQLDYSDNVDTHGLHFQKQPSPGICSKYSAIIFKP